MDKYGQGVEFQFSRLQKNKELCFAGFTNQMVLEMCILSGCDYLQSLPGMGLKRAHALISKFKTYEKHVGFASIEAKRKFKTPRKSPTSSVPVDSSCLKEFCFVGAGSGTSPRTMMETLAEPMFTESPSSEEEKANMGDIPLKALVQPLNQSGQAVLKECETKTNQKQERKKVIVRSRYFQHKSTNDECQVSKQIHRSNGDHLSVTNGRARVTSPCFAENRHEEKELKILDVVHRSRKQINPKCKLRETTSSIKFKEANYSIFA
ncbi:Exonuclease 1 [Linum grandiflorum]